jgi:hypothetical protein
MAASAIPLGVRDTTIVGWSLDLIFLLSLSLLPPPRRLLELALVLAATLSTMVVFAVERANPDILMFLLALAAGLLTQFRLGFRVFGYSCGLVAALTKYYPIMALIIVLRERAAISCAIGISILGLLALFGAGYHSEITRGVPNIARGPYNTDLFSAQNLPFLLAEAAGSAGTPLVRRVVGGGLYAALLVVCFVTCCKLWRLAELRVALASLAPVEHVLLVIGSAVIAGCFFAGQSIGYRGVFLLLIFPGLLAIARAAKPGLRNIALGTSIVILLLMWGECLRLAIYRGLDALGVSDALATELKIQFWLARELCWWWTVSVMLVVLADFLQASPIVRRLSALLGRSTVPAR